MGNLINTQNQQNPLSEAQLKEQEMMRLSKLKQEQLSSQIQILYEYLTNKEQNIEQSIQQYKKLKKKLLKLKFINVDMNKNNIILIEQYIQPFQIDSIFNILNQDIIFTSSIIENHINSKTEVLQQQQQQQNTPQQEIKQQTLQQQSVEVQGDVFCLLEEFNFQDIGKINIALNPKTFQRIAIKKYKDIESLNIDKEFLNQISINIKSKYLSDILFIDQVNYIMFLNAGICSLDQINKEKLQYQQNWEEIEIQYLIMEFIQMVLDLYKEGNFHHNWKLDRIYMFGNYQGGEQVHLTPKLLFLDKQEQFLAAFSLNHKFKKDQQNEQEINQLDNVQFQKLKYSVSQLALAVFELMKLSLEDKTNCSLEIMLEKKKFSEPLISLIDNLMKQNYETVEKLVSMTEFLNQSLNSIIRQINCSAQAIAQMHQQSQNNMQVGDLVKEMQLCKQFSICERGIQIAKILVEQYKMNVEENIINYFEFCIKKNRPQDALAWYQKLKKAESLESSQTSQIIINMDAQQKFQFLYLFGNAYLQTQNYELSITNYLNALRIAIGLAQDFQNQKIPPQNLYFLLCNLSQAFLNQGQANNAHACLILAKYYLTKEVPSVFHFSQIALEEKMGSIYFFKNQILEAEQCFALTIELTCTYFTNQHIYLIEYYINYSLVLQNQQKLDLAEEKLKNALNICNNVVSDRQYDYNIIMTAQLMILYRLVKIYQIMNNIQEQRETYLKIIELIKENEGDSNYFLIKAYRNFGEFYLNINQLEQAQAQFEKGIDLIKLIKGDGHLSLAKFYSNLGYINQVYGKTFEAQQYFEQACTINQNCGDYNMYRAKSLADLGNIYFIQGLYQQAEDQFIKSLSVAVKADEDECQLVAYNFANLGNIQQLVGNQKDAINYYQNAIRILKKVYGEQNQLLPPIYGNLAAVLFENNLLNESIQCYKNGIDIIKNKKDRGVNYNLLAGLFTNLGKVLIKQNCIEEGLIIQLKAYEMVEKKKCKDIFYIKTILQNLSMAYGASGKVELAEQFKKQALSIEIQRPTQFATQNQVGTTINQFTIEKQQNLMKIDDPNKIDLNQQINKIGGHSKINLSY